MTKKENSRQEMDLSGLLKTRRNIKDMFVVGTYCGTIPIRKEEQFKKDFKMIKHGWFAGRFLFNYEIMLDVKNKKISKEQATRYLMCSGQGKFYQTQSEDKKWCNDYVEYILDNWIEITDLLPK